jgi:A nuclease family of the HNH/ENDO VII superfamily with conserved AHH
MGSEFADPQKRPDPQKQQPFHAPKQPSGANLPKPPELPLVPIRQHPERMTPSFTGPQQDPNDGHKQLSWWTPEMAKTAVAPTRSAYRGGAKVVEQMTPEQREQYREFLANDPELSWLLDPNGKRPTPFEALQMKRKQQAAAQTQQLEELSPLPLKSESMQVASAAVQGHGAQPESPEQTLHHKFETDVGAKAQSLLKANKARLNAEQTQYTQDHNPKSDRWQHLWQAEGKRRAYETQEHQMVDERMRVIEESNGLGTALDPLYDKPADQARKKDRAAYLENRKAFLTSQIESARQMQVSLTYAYPALAAIKGETGENPQDIQTVQGRLPKTFNETRGDIDRLSKALVDDPSKAWLFDSVVAAQLKDKSLSPQQRQQLVQRIEQEHRDSAGGLMLGGLLSGGLFAASFIPGLQEGAIPLRLAGMGLGGGIAASEIPDLMLLDAAAQSGKGGAGQLTSQSPEQARFNLVMGYANVGLAGLDVGLEVGAVQKLAKVPGLLRSAASLTREQSRILVASLSRIKGKVTEAVVQRVTAAVRRGEPEVVIEGFGKVNLNEIRTGEVTTEQAVKKARVGAGGTSAAKSIQIADGLSDEAAEKLLAKYPQWNKVKDFVGRHLDPNNLPPGYKYRVKNNRPELYRDSTEGPFPPLTVKNGVVELQTGTSSRLSVYSRYKKNYLDWVEQTQGKAARTAAEQRIKDGNQLHHLTPDAVVQRNDLTKELMRRSKNYTLDRGTNILDMPTLHNPKTGEIVHLGSHDEFNKYAERLLDQKVERLTGDGAIPLDKVNINDIDKAVRQVEDTLREQIKNRTLPESVLKELEGGGFKISESIQDSQGDKVA